MKRLSWALLPLLAFLNACPKRTTSPDYDSVRQHSEQSHQSLDQQHGSDESH